MSEKFMLPKHPLFKNITGQRFGRLIVLSYAGRHGPMGRSSWLCSCDCGEKVTVVAGLLISGKSQSCGCLQREWCRENKATHGKSKTVEYRVWAKIKERCYVPSARGYEHYGGRGITMSESWRNSFETFLSDMGKRPSDEHEIDRKDTNGNYEKGNCRWVTRIVNARNKRTRHELEFKGRSQCISEWAEELGVKPYVIQTRLRRGWSVERALSTS